MTELNENMQSFFHFHRRLHNDFVDLRAAYKDLGGSSSLKVDSASAYPSAIFTLLSCSSRAPQAFEQEHFKFPTDETLLLLP